MGASPWQSRYAQDPWELIHRCLSISGSLAAMPSGNPICKGMAEVRSGLSRIQTLIKHDGCFYLCNLKAGFYDLVFAGIPESLPYVLHIRLRSFKPKAPSGKLKSSDPLDFELKIAGAATVNGWIWVLRFGIEDQRISEINQWNKEVTHA